MYRPKKKTALFLSLSLAVAAAWAGKSGVIDAQRYLKDVQYLASPELGGRGAGTPELEKAAEYIAKQFRGAGLKPVTGDRTYYQAFPVTINAKLGPGNRLAYKDGGERTELKLNEDFVPFNFSAKAEVAGPVVFAGYGITAPEYGYDDYADVDVKGKLVLVLRHEPQEMDDKSVFAGKMLTDHSQFPRKASNAKAHGAAGLILINDRYNHPGDSDQLEQFVRTAGPTDAGIPFLQVKSEVAERWFRAAGKNLEEIQAGIDKDLRGRAFSFPTSLEIEGLAYVEREDKTVHNVAAYLPGRTDEYIVIGAHYDHLGLGEQYSMAPSQKGTVHPGADDNASGVAGVLELARWFASQPKAERGVLFLAFAGEELGLLGSSFYVRNAELPIAKAVAMINLDMIGRIRDSRVYVGGIGTGTTLKTLLEETIPKHQLMLDFSDAAGYGSSDHTSFTAKQVPVLFFFSGLHGDYHRPSDTWDKIDAPAAAKLLALVGDLSKRLIASSERPRFVRVKPAAGAAGMAGGGPGYGASFGSVPDFGFNGKGVKFADVREGTPAAKAGLKGGDVLVEFAGKPIDNLYDFANALRAHKPGEVVPVKVLRDGAEMKVDVTLEKRQ